jgi:type IV pilus assembly protein PilO
VKLRFSKRDQLIIGAGTLVLVLVIVYAQFFMLTPLNSDIGIKQQALETEQKLLDIISQKKTSATTNKTEDTRELQKHVPVEPLQEMFILDLERAETVSKSQIKSMTFSKDTEVNPGEGQVAAENGNVQEASTAAQNTTTQSEASQTASDQQSEPLAPKGLKKLTVSLSVESPSYEEFEKFIETLESLKRTVVIESIDYAGGTEVTSLEQNNQPFTYILTASAFYMPNLTDLEAEVPKIDAPESANKDNPLSQFPSTAQAQP